MTGHSELLVQVVVTDVHHDRYQEKFLTDRTAQPKPCACTGLCSAARENALSAFDRIAHAQIKKKGVTAKFILQSPHHQRLLKVNLISYDPAWPDAPVAHMQAVAVAVLRQQEQEPP